MSFQFYLQRSPCAHLPLSTALTHQPCSLSPFTWTMYKHLPCISVSTLSPSQPYFYLEARDLLMPRLFDTPDKLNGFPKCTESWCDSLAKYRPTPSLTFILVLHTQGSLLWAPQSLLLPKGQFHLLSSKGPLMTVPAQRVPLHTDNFFALHIWHLALSTSIREWSFVEITSGLTVRY